MPAEERIMSTSTPHPADSVTCVFGLTRSQLGPILASIAGEPVASFGVSVEHHVPGYYGYSAEKVIPTFSYTTRSGGKGRETCLSSGSTSLGPRKPITMPISQSTAPLSPVRMGRWSRRISGR